jgi:hypothetical protein
VARFDRDANVTSLGARQYGQNVCNRQEGFGELSEVLISLTLSFATIG